MKHPATKPHLKRTVLTFITLFAVTAARASDLASTFHFNPSLSREANPLVAQLGVSARVLVAANVVAVVLFLLLPLLVYWRGHSKKVASAPQSIWDFAALCLYNQVMSRGQLIRAILLCWPFPKDWFQVLRLWGLAASWGIAFGSFAAAFSWWALSGWHWEAYHTIYSTLSIGNYPLLLVFIAIPGAIFGGVMFFRLEYAERRRHDSLDMQSS